MSLAMDPAGAVRDLRDCIVEVLLESLLPIVDGDRFPDGHKSVLYLRGVLHLCLACTDAGLRRAQALQSLLTSDVRELLIQLRVPSGAKNINIRAWATSVSRQLLSTSISMFARHCSCNSLTSI